MEEQNYHTRMQIQNWLKQSVINAQNPDDRERIKKLRLKKKEKISKRFGF